MDNLQTLDLVNGNSDGCGPMGANQFPDLNHEEGHGRHIQRIPLARAAGERAKSLLLDPNVRVSETAFEAGFQSLTHFNRVFKNLTGTSPSEFRKQAMTG
jgi:hypothetical protein